jgi:hypothetical protein
VKKCLFQQPASVLFIRTIPKSAETVQALWMRTAIVVNVTSGTAAGLRRSSLIAAHRRSMCGRQRPLPRDKVQAGGHSDAWGRYRVRRGRGRVECWLRRRESAAFGAKYLDAHRLPASHPHLQALQGSEVRLEAQEYASSSKPTMTPSHCHSSDRRSRSRPRRRYAKGSKR